MSLARVHNFSISLDGFATGEGQTREAPFGHAGERLHQWLFATQWWHAAAQRAPRGVPRDERTYVATCCDGLVGLPGVEPGTSSLSAIEG